MTAPAGLLRSYPAALAWLADHYDMERLIGSPDVAERSLDEMWTLMGLLDDPQDQVPAVHVTGTNGKGSTVRAAVELFGASGLVAGSYTSPHLDRVNDRIAVANKPLDDADFAAAVGEIAAVESLAENRSGTRPSYFDVLSAAAYSWFARVAHVNVIEVGMGGRWDSTNTIEAKVAVITNIGEEHLEIIGPTLADVATEKAGIVKAGAHVVLGETDPALVEVVAAVAAEHDATLWLAERDYAAVDRHPAVGGQVLDIVTPFGRHEEVFVPLHGAHQGDNAATALTAVEAFFGRALSAEVVHEAFAELRTPGRFEILRREPVIVTDGAHNPLGAEAAAATMSEVFGFGARRPAGTPRCPAAALVLGVSRPHDPAAMAAALRASDYDVVVAAGFDWPRSLPPA
ncbi:MAG TPA: bifunctional folylpolyglutamate synthase/dihydrofolate synthase, partial [Acidimicrobiaceae bacterium]|nr:bifunctional folylpolyglutamate synthase/dihydrofolate synthase [Acidimicrobiaceae bacterium]